MRRMSSGKALQLKARRGSRHGGALGERSAEQINQRNGYRDRTRERRHCERRGILV